MPSLDITQILQAYNVLDFGANRDARNDAYSAFMRAFEHISNQPVANGRLFVPPGTYQLSAPPEVPSNLEIAGFGSATVIQLGPSRNGDVLKSSGTSNVRIRNLRLDGNRANNTSGTRQGLYLANVTDAWIENVEVISCRADGIRLEGCVRVELKAPRASDNGRHGISLSDCEFCQIISPRCYDNSQVESAGTGDGINLEMLTRYTTIIAALCYETAGVGDRQGYPIREAAGEGCHHNVILGGAGWGNRTSNSPSLDSGDSACIWPGLVSVPGGITITP